MRTRTMLLGAALAMGTWAFGPGALGAGAWSGEEGKKGQELEVPEERDALEFVREAAPEMQDEFFRVKRERPAAFRKKLRSMAPMLKDPETREALKRQMKLELQVRRLTAQMRKADGKEREAVKKELAQALSEQFDAKLELQVRRLQKMKEGISQLESRINKRKAQKDEIVKKRLNELSGESESWDW